jgi:hypothetical protein
VPNRHSGPSSVAIAARKSSNYEHVNERADGSRCTRIGKRFVASRDRFFAICVTHLIECSADLRYNCFVGKAKKGKEVYEMNPTSMLELADRYLNDPQFKEQMRKDPEGTAESTGLKFDDEDRQSIREWDMSSSGDEQLKERISKGVGTN